MKTDTDPPPAEAPCSLKRRRDLAIDVAVRRIINVSHPEASECEIQAKGSMQIGSGRYVVSYNEKPVALIEIEGEDRFRLTVL